MKSDQPLFLNEEQCGNRAHAASPRLWGEDRGEGPAV